MASTHNPLAHDEDIKMLFSASCLTLILCPIRVHMSICGITLQLTSTIKLTEVEQTDHKFTCTQRKHNYTKIVQRL